MHALFLDTPPNASARTHTHTHTLRWLIANANLGSGLDLSAGLKLENYMHMRKPELLSKVPINDRATLSKSLQFLDPLTLDKPKGSWSLKHDAGNKMVLLRSLVFPGYVHFNCTGSSMYGGIYNGAGARNLDLPFML